MPRQNTIDETAEDAGVGVGVAEWAQAGTVAQEDEEGEDTVANAGQLWQPRRGGDTPFRPSRGAARQGAAAAAAGEQRQIVPRGRGGAMLRGWGSLRGGVSLPPPAQGTPGSVYGSSPGERLIQIPVSRGADVVDREGGGGGGGSRLGRRPGGGAPQPRGGLPEATISAPQQQQQQQPWRWKKEEEQQARPRRQSPGAAALPPQHRRARGVGGAGDGGDGEKGERKQQQQQQGGGFSAAPHRAQPSRRRLWSLRSSKGVTSFHEPDSDTSRVGERAALPPVPSSPLASRSSVRAVFR